MSRSIIVVGPITYAMKGRNLLAHYGFNCRVERVNLSSGRNGCGFGIYVPDRTDEAERILRQAGIPVSGRSGWGGSL